MLWLSVHCRDKWKIDRHDALRRKCLFRFLRRFAYPVEGNRIFCQIYFFLFPELLHDIICQLLIKIITTKMVVPRRCKYLDQSLSDFNQRNIKRTASQVVYHDLLWLSIVQAISQRRGSRFVDDPQHFKPCDPACILGRLALRIIKISRNCDHRLIHRLAEITFCILFQLHQNIRRNFLRRITFSVNLFSPGRSHLPFHRENRAIHVRCRLALRHVTDKTLAFFRKCYYRRSSPASLCIHDHRRLPALHDCYAAVCRS